MNTYLFTSKRNVCPHLSALRDHNAPAPVCFQEPAPVQGPIIVLDVADQLSGHVQIVTNIVSNQNVWSFVPF